MEICPRARYDKKPLRGIIRASLFSGKIPVEFKMTLYDETKGFITLPKDRFKSMDEARGVASMRGFSILHWDVTKCEA